MKLSFKFILEPYEEYMDLNSQLSLFGIPGDWPSCVKTVKCSAL